jgi:hypothetical protein
MDKTPHTGLLQRVKHLTGKTKPQSYKVLGKKDPTTGESGEVTAGK